MRRSYAAMLVAVLLAVVGCTADDEQPPAPSTSVEESSTPTATAAVETAWGSPVEVRPDSVGRGAPWLWEYSDDVVVVGSYGLTALDR